MLKEISRFCEPKKASVFVRMPEELKERLQCNANNAKLPLATYVRTILDEKTKESA